MKVLQINSVCGIGSTGRIAVDLYKMLEKSGHECCIAYGRGTAPKELNTIKIGTKFDVYHHGLMSRITDRHGFYSRHATKVFIERAKQYNPDVIHLHNIHGYYINIELLFRYLKESGKPIIWTLHDCWAFTGHCAHFDFVGCDRWKTECHDCPQKIKYPKSLTDSSPLNYDRKKKLFISLEDMHIIVPSNWMRQMVECSFLKKYTCNVIYNGIDLDTFSFTQSTLREKYNLKNKTVILGVSNIWDERKGLNLFVQLSLQLSDDYQIVLIGLSKKQIKKLPNNILGIRRTSDIMELVEWYSLADIYFNASVEESMGLTTVEALACGTPAIVCSSTASPELVNSHCGYILPNTELTTILSVLSLPIWKQISKEECRKQSLFFNKSKRYLQYLDIYREKYQ